VNAAPAIIHRNAHLDSGDIAAAAHRSDVIELCERHGLDAKHVAWIERTGWRRLQFGVLLTDDRGKHYLACGCTRKIVSRDDIPDHKCKVATETVEKTLVGSLPTWWRRK
jgi:hypothetical protein